MSLIEEVRAEAFGSGTLRCMSLFRQYLLDLKTYIENCVISGGKPKLELENLDYVQSKAFSFLR